MCRSSLPQMPTRPRSKTGLDLCISATTLAVAVLCLGGIQLICLGILGEYLDKVYTEVKRRPPYIVAETLQSGGAHES